MGLLKLINNSLTKLVLVAIAIVLCVTLTGASAMVPYTTERENIYANGNQMTGAGGLNFTARVSQDGRYVAFASGDSAFATSDTNGVVDVFVRDRKTGTNVQATLTSTGGQLSSGSFPISSFDMSGSGRQIAFTSAETGIVPFDTTPGTNLFLRDLDANTTEMIDISSTGGTPSAGVTTAYDISADGRYVTFSSASTDIVAGDTNAVNDVFVRDRKLSTTTRISVANAGTQANARSLMPALTCDGSYVAFVSEATNLVSGDTNGQRDVFVVNRIGGNAIENITLTGNADAALQTPDMSCNGGSVVYASDASNLVASDTNSVTDLFAYNMPSATTQRVNVDSSGNQTSGTLGALSNDSVDFSGRYIVFESRATNLVSGDTNGNSDIFMRDLKDGTTQIISKRSSSTQATNDSNKPVISLDGRWVSFFSLDTGLVSGDTNSQQDVFASETGITY